MTKLVKSNLVTLVDIGKNGISWDFLTNLEISNLVALIDLFQNKVREILLERKELELWKLLFPEWSATLREGCSFARKWKRSAQALYLATENRKKPEWHLFWLDREEKQYPGWGWCTFYFPHINREIAKKGKKGFELNETGDGVEEKALREQFWASETSHLTVGVHLGRPLTSRNISRHLLLNM